jgi:hypothetical protein
MWPWENDHHGGDGGAERQGWGEKADIVGDQPDQDGADEAAGDGAQAADDHHDEDEDGHVSTDRGGDDLLIHRPHRAADAGECRPHHEHADEQTADAKAQSLDHFPVFHAGPHEQTDAGAVEHKGHSDPHDKAENHGHDAVFLDRGTAHEEAAAQRHRAGDFQLLRAPCHHHELFGDDQATDGDQDLLEMRAVDTTDQ